MGAYLGALCSCGQKGAMGTLKLALCQLSTASKSMQGPQQSCMGLHYTSDLHVS